MAPRLAPRPTVGMARQFHGGFALRNESFFGEVTKNDESRVQETNTEQVDSSNITPATDKALQEKYMEEARAEQISAEKYISPLKRKLFDLNVAQHGFFKNHQILRDPDAGKAYKLSLTAEEIEALEPSIYLKSYRIKSSTKKATVVNRLVRGYTVKSAINQLHFNPKKMATELERLLKRGLEQARKLNYDEDQLYIHALWVGSDGNWQKRVDPKARGRTGIISHSYVHLRAVLRTDLTTKRLRWEKDQAFLAAKPSSGLNTEPLNFSVRPYFRW